MTVAVLPDVVLEAPISFALGIAVGFVLSNRYRITRRNGHTEEDS